VKCNRKCCYLTFLSIVWSINSMAKDKQIPNSPRQQCLDQSRMLAIQSFQRFYNVLLWVSGCSPILKILWVVVLMIWYDISLSAVGGVRHTITSMWCTLGNILGIKNVYNSWHTILKTKWKINKGQQDR
jgi:hypothetical protein